MRPKHLIRCTIPAGRNMPEKFTVEIRENESFERTLQLIYRTTTRICAYSGLKCDLEYWAEARKKFMETYDPNAERPPAKPGFGASSGPNKNLPRNYFGVPQVVDGKKRIKLSFIIEQK